MGSVQVGLIGLKGSIVRKAAVSSSLSNLQKALTAIRTTLKWSRNTLAADVSCECRVLSELFPILRILPDRQQREYSIRGNMLLKGVPPRPIPCVEGQPCALRLRRSAVVSGLSLKILADASAV